MHSKQMREAFFVNLVCLASRTLPAESTWWSKTRFCGPLSHMGVSWAETSSSPAPALCPYMYVIA